MSQGSGAPTEFSIDHIGGERKSVLVSESGTPTGHRCRVTGLTESERATLIKSWTKMKGTTLEDLHELGLNLVLWMMDNIPDMRKRFHKFPASSAASVLKVDKEFLRHSRKVIVELDDMVKALNVPDVLKSRALKLARRHLDMDPPIGSEFFDPFYEKFHVFIETSLDLPPEHEEVQLWTAFLSFVIAVLKVEEAKHRTKPTDTDICCKYRAVVCKLKLPSSCYATMALREILRTDTSAAYHTSLNVGTSCNGTIFIKTKRRAKGAPGYNYQISTPVHAYNQGH